MVHELFEDEIVQEKDDLIDEEVDLDHLGLMRYAGRELMSQGKEIGQPFPAYAWEYLVEHTLITINCKEFRDNVQLMYIRAMDDSGDSEYLPTVREIADAIDEWNMIIIHEFYKKNEYTLDEIDVILGNYIQEFSCLMEDWVEITLQNVGVPYAGSSVMRYKELKDEYAPQNILLTEFLR